MAKFDSNGYLEGRLHVFALWFVPGKGPNGRIAGIVKHKGEFMIGDISCASKFWGGRCDSLRKGWESDDPDAMVERYTKYVRKMRETDHSLYGKEDWKNIEDRLAKANEIGKFNILLPLMGISDLSKIPNKCYRIWPTGHYTNARIDVGRTGLATMLEFYPRPDITPYPILQLASRLNASWPIDVAMKHLESSAREEKLERIVQVGKLWRANPSEHNTKLLKKMLDQV